MTNKTRRAKQEWFEIRFLKAKREKATIDGEKMLGRFAIECFSTRRTGKEILKAYEDVGFIKINEHGHIVVK